MLDDIREQRDRWAAAAACTSGTAATNLFAAEHPDRAKRRIRRRSAIGAPAVCCLIMKASITRAKKAGLITARKLSWAVGIPRHLKVYPADVQMIWPVARRGRPRQRHVPDILSIPAEDMLAHAKWRTISRRTGTKGKLKARFAAVRVRVADRMSGEKKYYLANLPAKTDLRTLAPLSRRDGFASRLTSAAESASRPP
jgi:DDE superfamily endonuclease